MYLHEVAHYLTYKAYQQRVLPHGREWQQEFSNLIRPLIENRWVPENLMAALHKNMNRPKAASGSDVSLLRVLRSFDPEDDLMNLECLSTKALFTFKGRPYQKLATRRTRVLCKNLNNGRNYLIALMARVKPEVCQLNHEQ